MQREGFDLPLMIGGATTSPAHTAVKIEPAYNRAPIIHVHDASRAVGVVSKLLSDKREAFWEETREKFEKIRVTRARNRNAKTRLPLEKAREKAFDPDKDGYTPVKPKQMGVTPIEDVRLKDLEPYLDWTPFFMSWDMKGTYPKIFDDPNRGQAARELFEDGQKMLRQMVDEDWLHPKGVVGLWPAQRVGDDIEVFADEDRKAVAGKFHGLRQQSEKSGDRPYLTICDFVSETQPDYVGGFAVTAGTDEDDIIARFKADKDDYSEIMFKALADRFAEAFAEYLHERVRKEIWGYAPDESLTTEQLIGENYAGIRPAAGYPAQPDHTEKDVLFELLQATQHTGIALTESRAMNPPASVAGLYFAHPESAYFAVGRIAKDQVEDYAARKGWSLEEAERHLAPILGYDPDSQKADVMDAAE